jgi:hypothetical protein
MKIRQGFVSNSSSSSFICDICGMVEAGHDSQSNEDYGLVQCINDHTFCEDEAYDLEDGEETMVEDEWGDERLAEGCCPICCFDVGYTSELDAYFKKITKVTEENVLQYIREKHPKRTGLYDSEYIDFHLMTRGICRSDLLAQLKTEFKTYKEFLKFIG